MKLRVFNDTLIGGQWTGVGVGNFAPSIAEHLIQIGNAEPYETKVVEAIETKKAQPSLSSQAAPVSPDRTVKRRRGRPKKSSS